MRQVGRSELTFVVSRAVGRLGPGLIRGLTAGTHSQRKVAQDQMTEIVVDALKRYEIMVDAPPYPGDSAEWSPNGRSQG